MVLNSSHLFTKYFLNVLQNSKIDETNLSVEKLLS